MNWLTNFVRPKLRQLVGGQKEIPDDLWHKCPECEEMIFHRDLVKNLSVCQHCGHHMRIGASARLEMLFGGGAYETVETETASDDPLNFRDQKKYTERLKEARSKTGTSDALAVATGRLDGIEVVIAVLDFEFMGGSMGIAVGDGMLTAARLSVSRKAALIVISSSGGARMQEGVLSLMQLPRTTIAVDLVREARLPYIVVLADPTTGGVSASFAMLGDIAIAESGAVIGFAGPRVIEQTIGEKLPDDFQTAEYLLDHGMVDMVVTRHQLRDTLTGLVSLLARPGPDAPAKLEKPQPPVPAEDRPAE